MRIGVVCTACGVEVTRDIDNELTEEGVTDDQGYFTIEGAIFTVGDWYVHAEPNGCGNNKDPWQVLIVL